MTVFSPKSEPRPSSVGESTESTPESLGPPTWLVMTAVVAGGTVLSLGVGGLFLAIIGQYRPVLAYVAGASILTAFCVLVVPALPRPRATRRTTHILAVIGVSAIAAIAVWNTANVSQHVLINRDGGIYANAGRWIARDGTLEVRAKVGAFRGERTLHFNDIGLTSSRTTVPRLQFGVAHLVPALLAEAHAIGGDDGMFKLPPWLCAIALLEFFVLAWQLFRNGVFALAAMLALAFIIPEVSFARDTYTEIPVQIFVFGALVLLIDRRVLPSWRAALGAGLLLGATQATRIDAALVFVGVPILMLVPWLRARSEHERNRLRQSNVALVAGIVPGCLLGVVDLVTRSGGYWNSHWNNERTLVALTAVSVVACVVIVKVWPRLSQSVSALPWNTISWVAAATVLLAAFGAWFVRPSVYHLHEFTLGGVQRSGHYVSRYMTLKYESSMSWMWWYLGPITMLAAIVAAACLARAVLRGRMLYTLAPVLILLPGSVLYLWDANAYTDHVWVTRRFLSGAFPMLILLALGLATYLWRARQPERFSMLRRAIAIVVTAAAVAFPVYTLIPVGAMREQSGYLTAVHHACRTMGPKPVVVVLLGPTLVSDVREDWVPQTLRSWCGATVATMFLQLDASQTLSRLNEHWTAKKRKVFVVATGAAPILQVAPGAKVTQVPTAVNKHLLSQAFTHRPWSYETESLPIFVGSLPHAPAR